MCDFKALKERAPDETKERRRVMGTPSCCDPNKDSKEEMEETKDCNARMWEPDWDAADMAKRWEE